MALKLMYITNNTEVAQIAQIAGVDRIWVDMEFIGKDDRQAGMDTVKSRHTVEDIRKIKPYITSAELLVRVNPVHTAVPSYPDTREEIEEAIAAGAEILMLPMFKSKSEVAYFLECVNGRAKTQLLFETAEAVENIEDILSLPGIDEVHIGLNDLHLAYGRKFMFELLCGDVVRDLCRIFRERGLPYGFGGIARVGFGLLPAEYVIAEHYHLGSTAAILSRSFCNANRVDDPNTVKDIFVEGVRNIRAKEDEVSRFTEAQYRENLDIIRSKVEGIVASL